MELHVCTNLPKFVELLAQGPHSHILMTGGGGGAGGGSEWFFGSEILARSDFFGSMKYDGIFLGHEKTQRDVLGLGKKD